MTTKYISSLFVYPIKSCAGISVEEAQVTPAGFAHDREYMLVDERGVFISQRKYPRMALIRPRIDRNVMTLEAPDTLSISVDLNDFSGERMSAKVWDDTVDALLQSVSINQWFQEFLHAPGISLVRFVPDVHRYIDRERLGEGIAESKFADQYPITLVSEASIADLNARLKEKVDATRFRPNIVVSGFEPYEEDTAERLRIVDSDIVLKIVKPVKRCKIVNVNPQKGLAESDEVLSTLASYRGPQAGKSGILFCMKAIVEKGTDRAMRVGDVISLPD